MQTAVNAVNPYYKKARELYEMMDVGEQYLFEDKEQFLKVRKALATLCSRRKIKKTFKTKSKTLIIWRVN